MVTAYIARRENGADLRIIWESAPECQTCLCMGVKAKMARMFVCCR